MTTGESPYKKEPEFTPPSGSLAPPGVATQMRISDPKTFSLTLGGPARVVVVYEERALSFAEASAGMVSGGIKLPPRDKRLLIALLETALEEVRAL